MENIKAVFNSRSDMEAAMAALREQGVIDMKLQAGENCGEASLNSLEALNGITASMNNDSTNGSVSPYESLCGIEIVVESSRFRQTEDTIVRYGGQYEGQGLK